MTLVSLCPGFAESVCFFLLNICEPETHTIFLFCSKKKDRHDAADLLALDAVNEAGGGSQSGRFTTTQANNPINRCDANAVMQGHAAGTLFLS